MLIALRTDASIEIGSGHIMRCVTVANALKTQGHHCWFICRRHHGNLIAWLQNQAWPVLILDAPTMPMAASDDETNAYQQWLGVSQENDATATLDALHQVGIDKLDWLLVDHYALSAVWEQALRPIATRIAVIDDLANRQHDADLILDCGFNHQQHQYQSLNKRPVSTLLGPLHALLRPEFAFLRPPQPRLYSGTLERLKLLINLGGVDKDNLTSLILHQLQAHSLPYAITVTVVMGASAPHQHHVITQAQSLPFPTQVLVNVSNMAALMCEHDVAIGAAGSSAWERCCLGLPAIMICLADNQAAIAQTLQQMGAAISIRQDQVQTRLLAILQQLTAPTLQRMSQQAWQITDGNGVNLLLQQLQPG